MNRTPAFAASLSEDGAGTVTAEDLRYRSTQSGEPAAGALMCRLDEATDGGKVAAYPG